MRQKLYRPNITYMKLCKEISKRSGIREADIVAITNIFFMVVMDYLKKDFDVKIKQFGTFRLVLGRHKVYQVFEEKNKWKLGRYSLTRAIRFLPAMRILKFLNGIDTKGNRIIQKRLYTNEEAIEAIKKFKEGKDNYLKGGIGYGRYKKTKEERPIVL